MDMTANCIIRRVRRYQRGNRNP